jgi:hypothetical protein
VSSYLRFLIPIAFTGWIAFQLYSGTGPQARADDWFPDDEDLDRWETPIRYWISIGVQSVFCAAVWYFTIIWE